MDKLKRDFSILYVCENCDKSNPPPTHCGKAMQLETIESDRYWVCWKGDHAPCCGTDAKYAYEDCCNNPELTQKITNMLM